MHIISRWYKSWDNIYLEMIWISRWCASWDVDAYHLKMVYISRWLAYRDDTYFDIHISRRYESWNKYYLDMHIILRWYASQDDIYLYSYLEVHLKINDTNLEIIDIHLEMHKKNHLGMKFKIWRICTTSISTKISDAMIMFVVISKLV